MRKGQRKKAQKELTRLIRKINRDIEKDNWWNGRFYMAQASSDWHAFEDGSGGVLYTTLVCVDKKNKTMLPMFYDFLPGYRGNSWHLFQFMNDFIVKYTNVWNEDKNPRSDIDTTDYTTWPRIDFKANDLRNIIQWYQHH